jgi:tetratricopeptide (TPR) repeat protein
MSWGLFLVVLGWQIAAGIQSAHGQPAATTIPDLQKRTADHIAQAEKALRNAEDSFPPDHPNVAVALNNLGEAHRFAAAISKDESVRRKEAAAAEAMHARALAIREKALGLRHSFTLASMVNLAHVYRLQGRNDDAEAAYRRALGVLTEIGPGAGILTELAQQANQGLAQIDKARRKIEAAAPTHAASEHSYVNPEYRWSISYPADWKIDSTDRLFVRLSRGPAIVGIHTFPDAAGKSLDESADAALQRWEQSMRKVNLFTQVSRQRLSLSNNLPAIEVIHHIGRGVVGKSRKLIAVARDRVFWIDAETTLAAWPDYERDFNRIIESFRILE